MMLGSRVRLIVLAVAAACAACGGENTAEPVKDDSVCTDVGFCSDSVDVCTCGTSCRRLGPGHYSCEISCEQAADCAEEKHPIRGSSFTECIHAAGQNDDSYDKYCH